MTQSQPNPQCADAPTKETGWLLILPSSFASASRLQTGLVVAGVLILALLLRVIHLDADPSALISRDFITDEGWWTHNARNAIFHGQFRMDDYNLGFYSSPLYNYAIYAVLKLLGISFISVRLLPAACGWLTVAALLLLVRKEINTRAALFAAILLGCSNLHVLYSRTGFVESPMVFLLALTLLLWSLRRSHALFSFASGLAFGVMVIAKITAIYLVPGLLLMWAALIIRDSSNVKHVIHSLFGIFLSGAVFVALYVIPNFHDWLHFNISNGSGSEWSNESGGLILSLLKLPDSYFNKLPAMIAGLTLVPLTLFAVAVSKSGWKRAIRETPEIELIGGSLLIGYLIPLAFTIYQPERRFIPALLLGVILTASILERGVTASGESLLGEPEGWGWALWFGVLFFLPALVIVKFKWAALGSPLSVRFWATKSVAVALFIWISWAVSRRLSSRAKRGLLSVIGHIFVLVFASLCLAAVYRALALSGLDWRAAIKSPGGRSLGILILVGVTFASLVLGWKAMRFGLSRPGWLILAFLVVEGIQMSTWLLQPTYTLRDASEYFAGTLTADDTVVTYYETLLIPSAANVIRRSQPRGFNIDAFQRFDPRYTLILRRDDWMYYPLEGIRLEEWPPPAGLITARVAGFDLCPTPGRGPRFTAELYRLDPRVRGHDKGPR